MDSARLGHHRTTRLSNNTSLGYIVRLICEIIDVLTFLVEVFFDTDTDNVCIGRITNNRLYAEKIRIINPGILRMEKIRIVTRVHIIRYIARYEKISIPILVDTQRWCGNIFEGATVFFVRGGFMLDPRRQ